MKDIIQQLRQAVLAFEPKPVKLITESYDLQHHRPTTEYHELITKIKAEFAIHGFEWG